MYWALQTDLVDRRGFRFEQVLADIQTLNQWARAGRLEVTAISLAAYPFVQEDYALLTARGEHRLRVRAGRRGPRRGRPSRRSATLEIVVPGALTTAFLTLRLVLGEFRYRELAVRGDSRRGGVRPGRRGAAHPRGPAHVRRARPRQGARPRRVVAARDRAAASARRQRRAPGRRTARRPVRGAPRVDSDGARPSRRSARVRTAVRSRHRRCGRRPVRVDVRQRPHARLRRRGSSGRGRAARRGSAIGAFPAPVHIDFV